MKLDTKKVIFVGLAFFLISIFWQAYDSIIPKILIDKFGYNQRDSGIIMALDNVLALFLLPFFGHLSDRTNHKRGKRTPYIIVGTVIAAFAFIALSFSDNYQLKIIEEAGVVEMSEDMEAALAPGEILSEAQYDQLRIAAWEATVASPFNRIVFILVLLVALFAMSTFRSPAVALMPDVTVKPLRSKANAIINLLGAAAGVTAIVLMMVSGADKGHYMSYSMVFIVVSIIMILALTVFLIKVNEPKMVQQMKEDSIKFGVEETVEESAVEKLPKEKLVSLILILASIFLWFMGYNAVTTKFSDYAPKILDMGFTLPLLIAQVAAIVAFIPVGIVATKIGRKKTILGGIIILTVSFGSAVFLTPTSSFLMYVVLLLAGVGWASINVNSYPMVVELSKGSNVGKYTGYYYTFSMSAQILTPILSGILMDAFGRKVLFPYAAFFVAMAFITMILVKHGDAKPVHVKSKLEYLDVED